MTKLEIQAIRKLPKEYVRDGTHFWFSKGLVHAISRDLPPIEFSKRSRKWKAYIRGPLKPEGWYIYPSLGGTVE